MVTPKPPRAASYAMPSTVSPPPMLLRPHKGLLFNRGEVSVMPPPETLAGSFPMPPPQFARNVGYEMGATYVRKTS